MYIRLCIHVRVCNVYMVRPCSAMSGMVRIRTQLLVATYQKICPPHPGKMPVARTLRCPSLFYPHLCPRWSRECWHFWPVGHFVVRNEGLTLFTNSSNLVTRSLVEMGFCLGRWKARISVSSSGLMTSSTLNDCNEVNWIVLKPPPVTSGLA